MCVLIIFDIAVRYMEVDLLVKLQLGIKMVSFVRCLGSQLQTIRTLTNCPLFGGVRCLECPLAEVPLYYIHVRVSETSIL